MMTFCQVDAETQKHRAGEARRAASTWTCLKMHVYPFFPFWNPLGIPRLPGTLWYSIPFFGSPTDHCCRASFSLALGTTPGASGTEAPSGLAMTLPKHM